MLTGMQVAQLNELHELTSANANTLSELAKAAARIESLVTPKPPDKLAGLSFWECVPYLNKGEVIRRKAWHNGLSVIVNGKELEAIRIDGEIGRMNFNLEWIDENRRANLCCEDYNAKDWEIIQ